MINKLINKTFCIKYSHILIALTVIIILYILLTETKDTALLVSIPVFDPAKVHPASL